MGGCLFLATLTGETNHAPQNIHTDSNTWTMETPHGQRIFPVAAAFPSATQETRLNAEVLNAGESLVLLQKALRQVTCNACLDCCLYPLVMTNGAIEKCHRNSEFFHNRWWFSRVMLVYQRVILWHPPCWCFFGLPSTKGILNEHSMGI